MIIISELHSKETSSRSSNTIFNLITLRSVLNTLSSEKLHSEEFRNKNLLGFFLAVMNSQLKIVNVFINKSDLLRRIVTKLLHVHDQHVLYGDNNFGGRLLS
jgi:hypothetical protein